MEADPEDGDNPALVVRYCAFCGAFCLITDADLSQCPRRKTDDTYIIDEDRYVCRFLMKADMEPVILRRSPRLLERQFRLLCKACSLPIAYRSDSRPGLIYIIEKALCSDPRQFMSNAEALR